MRMSAFQIIRADVTISPASKQKGSSDISLPKSAMTLDLTMTSKIAMYIVRNRKEWPQISSNFESFFGLEEMCRRTYRRAAPKFTPWERHCLGVIPTCLSHSETSLSLTPILVQLFFSAEIPLPLLVLPMELVRKGCPANSSRN